MPYIKQEDRKLFESALKILLGNNDIGDSVKCDVTDCNIGDLNYIITRIVHQWVKVQGLKYKNINAAIGVLDCAKM